MDTLSTSKGYIAALVSACAFGFINLFSVPLLSAGYSPTLILAYRTLFSVLGLSLVMLIKGIPFGIRPGDVRFLFIGSGFYFFSAWFLLIGYQYLHSGLATVLHFSYPIFVSLLLLLLFRIVPGRKTILAIFLAVAGVLGLSLVSFHGMTDLHFIGIPIALFSALAYAAYIVLIRYSRLSRFSAFRITFYVMLFNSLFFVLTTLLTEGNFSLLRTPSEWTNAILLAIIPTIVSNLSLVVAVQTIGSSKTSVLGAMEPVTTLLIGILVFNEYLSLGQAVSVLFIMASVIIVIRDKSKR